MIDKQINKEGGTITYGYNLTCSDSSLIVKASVDSSITWLRVTGDGASSGNLVITVDPNQGSSRGTTVQVNIYDTSTSTIASTCTQKYISISQAGDGAGGECKYTANFSVQPPIPCGEGFTITWTKTEPTPPGPTPGCDGSIVIHGSSTVTCDEMTTTLTAETTETCDATGIWKQANPYDAAGSSGNLVQIGTLSGCEGTWTFSGGEDIVTGITADGNKIMGVVKKNTTGQVRYKNITATCSNGCSNPFEIWQNGGSGTCEGITIQGSSTVTCDETTTTLTATTNN